MNRRAIGNEAEQRAVQLLERGGYTIVDRNFTCRWGEVDIIATKDELLCFVEVRMRSTAAWGDPSLTVTGVKQRKVVKAALHYMLRAGVSKHMMRFDVISVVGRGQDALLEHIPAAFDAGF